MTIVLGQIESLTRLKKSLNEKDIDRFKSVGEINHFIKNYEKERQEVLKQVEHNLDLEIDSLQIEGFRTQKKYNALLTTTKNKLNLIISGIRNRCDLIQSKNYKNTIHKSYNLFGLTVLKTINTCLEKNSERIIQLLTFRAKKRVSQAFKKINYYNLNRNGILTKLCASKLDELAYIKEVVEGLDNLIAGAIGENLVVK